MKVPLRDQEVAHTCVQDLVAATFLPFGFGVAFFLGAALAALAGFLAVGFFAGEAFFFGVLALGLVAAAGLVAFGLAVFLGLLLVTFFTPETSSQMSGVNERANGCSQLATLATRQQRRCDCYEAGQRAQRVRHRRLQAKHDTSRSTLLTCCLLFWSSFLGLAGLGLGCSRLRSCFGLGCCLALDSLGLLGGLLELISQLVAGLNLDKLPRLFQTSEVILQQLPAPCEHHRASEGA